MKIKQKMRKKHLLRCQLGQNKDSWSFLTLSANNFSSEMTAMSSLFLRLKQKNFWLILSVKSSMNLKKNRNTKVLLKLFRIFLISLPLFWLPRKVCNSFSFWSKCCLYLRKNGQDNGLIKSFRILLISSRTCIGSIFMVPLGNSYKSYLPSQRKEQIWCQQTNSRFCKCWSQIPSLPRVWVKKIGLVVDRSLLESWSNSILRLDEELRSFHSFFRVELRFQIDIKHQLKDKDLIFNKQIRDRHSQASTNQQKHNKSPWYSQLDRVWKRLMMITFIHILYIFEQFY